MTDKKIPIEDVQPGAVLGEDIYDPAQDKTVYHAGTQLTAEFINHILSLDYLEIKLGSKPIPSTERMPTKVFKPGEFICFQGEPANHIYILKDGMVQIILTEEDPPLDNPEESRKFVGMNGRIISHIQGKNVKFGEMAAILHGKRSASIKCNTEVHVVEIKANKTTLESTVIHNPKLGLSLALNIALRLKNALSGSHRILQLFKVLQIKLRSYQTTFAKIQSSLKTKSEENTFEWLKKLSAETRNIPPLSNATKYEPELPEKSDNIFEVNYDILPPEMEVFFKLNTNVTEQAQTEKCFYLLKKGRVQIRKGTTERYNILSKPGTLLAYETTLCGMEFPPGGTYLHCVSPVRAYRIRISDLESLAFKFPRVILFLARSLSQLLVLDDLYQYQLVERFEADLNQLAVGNTNYRRGFKKLTRIIEKFSKEPQITETELKLAETLKSTVDRDYVALKDELSNIFLRKTC
jgi:CRP-like cAMP-binding protein